MRERLLLGNEAVARGIWEAGCRFVSSYPGTPSTEITETAALYAEIDAEWAPNEKVALEAAWGAAVAGARSFCAQKHVGLNVAADPLFTASYTGVNAGLVVCVADDAGLHSSQNEQDSRHYARGAKLMMLEPSDAAECKAYTKLAFMLSEQFDAPVMLRLGTRVAHARGRVTEEAREDVPCRAYEKNTQKYVMMPAMAQKRHAAVEARLLAQAEWAQESEINTIVGAGAKIGVIASGVNYQYAREALGGKADYCKLGCVYPLPEKLLRAFCAAHETVYVIEDLDPFLEEQCKAMGLTVHGKDTFPLLGELSQGMVREAICGEKPPALSLEAPLPGRPPVLCPGCPHRSLFYALKQLDVFVSGDIGCYTLGALPPLEMLDTCLCMGASVSALHGRNKVRGTGAAPAVAVIGDSTFLHSGVTGLMNAAYNQSASVVIILDNSITGMTGHQQNPATGQTLKGDATAAVDLEALCRAVGIRHVGVVDPYDIRASRDAVKAALAAGEAAAVISRRPCALLKTVRRKPPLRVDAAKCVDCKRCMGLGCPALRRQDGKVSIDEDQCVGCGVCAQLCAPRAIGGETV